MDVRPDGVGCTLVRVRLGDSDRRTLVRVRERLLGAEHIVGTSIGRDAGPDDQGTFDILVVPDYDPVTVGREIADVDDVVGVAATAFESPDQERRPAVIDDDGPRTVPGSTADVAASDIRSTIQAGTEDATTEDAAGPAIPGEDAVDLPGVLESSTGGSDAADDPADARPVVGGLAALEGTDDRRAASGRPSSGRRRRSVPAPADDEGSRHSSNRAGANGRRDTADAVSENGPDALSTNGHGENGMTPTRHRVVDGEDRITGRKSDGIDNRLDRLDDRLSELESAFGVGGRGGVRGRRQGDGVGHPSTADLADRLAALEATVVELERRERRLRDALLGDSA